MSEGVICLSCRLYIGQKEWHCRCSEPRPSDRDPASLRAFAEEVARIEAKYPQPEPPQ